MARVNLSEMRVGALMDLRKRLTKPFTSVGPSFKSGTVQSASSFAGSNMPSSVPQILKET
jgi:hypothetical protein